MHRTQIMLDEEQYLAMKEMAQRSGKSMGQLVREFVALGLERRQKRSRDTLASLKGFIEEADVAGRDHDRVLYGEG